MNLCKPIVAGLALLLGQHLSDVHAQVNGPGISDPSLFTHVIDIPPSSIDGPECLGPDIVMPMCNMVGGVIGETTQVNLSDGGEIPRLFEAKSGSEINILGGTMGNDFSATDSEVNIRDGRVRFEFSANDSLVDMTGGRVEAMKTIGSTVNITGGYVDLLFALESDVNVDGGNVPIIFEIRSDSTVNLGRGDFVGGLVASESQINITGGDFGSAIWLEEAAEVNISGGNFDEFNSLILAFSGAEVNLFATQFLMDGMAIDLPIGETMTIQQRDVSLTGSFADGTDFEFQLSDSLPAVEFDYFAPDATVTVTLVPEPNAAAILTVLAGIASQGLRRLARVHQRAVLSRKR